MALPSCASANLHRDATVVGYTAAGLRVEVQAEAGCERCQQGKGCGAGLLQRPRRLHINVPVRFDAPSPDVSSHPPCALAARFPLSSRVRISMPRHSLTRLALWVYALPLVAALSGVGFLSVLDMASGWHAPALFFTTLIVSTVALKCKNRRDGERFRPRLVNQF
ncbi:SoxR reducing system RseC family protein [Halomonas massiliensis]|uniref:SoxR reducing system RseC family protein n=1 Tax=Vreelandella massiliensis TaxID=1816686 RepID=UPI00096A3896